VAASNGNDVWTAPVSSIPFTVLPSFYQTAWFRALCVFAGLVLLWFIFMARIRAISRAIRARAEERADERIRISRELHDTLLQGIQGLLLTFHVASEKLSANDASKKMLEKALSTADRIIIEGRNRVNSLRSEHLTDAELISSLENVCRDLKIDDKVQYRVNRSGIDATLHPRVADEIFSIAREALTNCVAEANPCKVLRFSSRFLPIGPIKVTPGRRFTCARTASLSETLYIGRNT
jgi:signal transduction histidine kinase